MRRGGNGHYIYQEMTYRRLSGKKLIYNRKEKYSITGKDKQVCGKTGKNGGGGKVRGDD